MSDFVGIYDTSLEPMEDLPVNSGLEESNPLLLLGEDDETRSMLSDYLVNFTSTHDRVNRWMIHQLRVSPQEIYALQRQVARYSPDV